MTSITRNTHQTQDSRVGSIVIYRTYAGERHGYAYLTGRIDAVTEDSQWCGTTFKVWNYALHCYQRVLASNVITEGATVEVHYHGERIACDILQIDVRTFEAIDAFGNTAWLMPTRITGVIETAWNNQQNVAVAQMEAIA